jgi:hypothetical protein
MPEALAELLTFKTAIVMALVAAAGCLRGF